nr:hypothetical protein [Tanacetum cinerariifolium]
EEGQPVSSYVLKMKGYIDNLERLGHPVTLGLGVSLILICLRIEFDGFVKNYNMHCLGKTINELHAMLKLHEQTLPKNNAPALHAIRAVLSRVAEKKNAASGASGSRIFVIELNTLLNRSWIYDTGCGTYIFNTTHGLRESRKLNLGALSFSIYAVSNKRAKLDLDSALLWHCLLGHISKKRIEKLQHDGILNSTDLRAFEKCVSCMSEKMARKPYTHQVERAKDLLGLIHTDVCGPFKIMSRQRASYFITFTDDYSRYGYVYLLKHKHEVFETFKVFQKEVENQLGYPKETMGYSFYYPPENNVLVAQNVEFLENSLITQEASGSLEDLKIIQEEDTHPSIDTSLNHEEDDLEINELQSDIVPIRRSTRTRHAPNHMCLYIDAEEHELGDLGEPANYKAALLDLESEKWLNAINMDVKTAFLNGYLNEEVYMEQLGGFVNLKYPNRKFGFTQNPDEPCVYLKASGSNITFLILYVDDILIMENNIFILQGVKSYLGRCFVMKDLGEAAYILGIKIYRDRSRRLIGLCQSADIKKILKRYCMENSKRGSILMQEKLKLSKSQGALTPAELKRMQNVLYASAIGSIMYVVRCTRPDVAFAHNVTSRFQHNPGDLHWTTVKNILKYLRNTKDMFLVYGGDLKRELMISCYIDAGYLMDVDDLKSQTGYVFVLNGGVVDWKSAKQSIFATSSAETKYIAAFNASKEAVWVRKFIYGLGVVLTIEEPISMCCDNTGAIDIANESGITKCARHFRAKVHYLREVIEYGDVKLEKVHTDDNLADPFTKALAFPKHSEHTRNIRMLPASSLIKIGLVFVNGPFPIEFPTPGDEHYEWFAIDKVNTEYDNFEEGISYIEDRMIELGPFDGVLGFSRIRRVTCGYPWTELEGNHMDFGMIRERLRLSGWRLSD